MNGDGWLFDFLLRLRDHMSQSVEFFQCGQRCWFIFLHKLALEAVAGGIVPLRGSRLSLAAEQTPFILNMDSARIQTAHIPPVRLFFVFPVLPYLKSISRHA